MTYTEGLQKALTVKWKTSPCNQGEKCWCRTIEPIEEIVDDDGNEIYISPSGTIHSEHAEHIVKFHNEYIDRIQDEANRLY